MLINILYDGSQYLNALFVSLPFYRFLLAALPFTRPVVVHYSIVIQTSLFLLLPVVLNARTDGD